jgi:hypothetical protein
VTLEFSESLLTCTILSKIEALHLLYTVQIIPRTDTVGLERLIPQPILFFSFFKIISYSLSGIC